MEGLHLLIITVLLVFIAVSLVYWAVTKATSELSDLTYYLSESNEDMLGKVRNFTNTGGISGEDRHELGSARSYLTVIVLMPDNTKEVWTLTKSQRNSMLERTRKNYDELVADGHI